MAAKREKKRHTGIVVLLLLFVFVVAAGYFGFILLRVGEIRITGNAQIGYDQIVEQSGLALNMHLLEINLQDTTDRLSENPYLDVLSIQREWWPPAITIEVKERRVDAVLKLMDKLIFIDREGRVLDISSNLDPKGKLEIFGMSVAGYTLGEPLAAHDPYQLAALEQVLKAVCGEEESSFSWIDISEPLDVRLFTPDNLMVRIGQVTELEAKLLLSKNAIFEISKSGRRGGTLDVTNGSDAAYSEQRSGTKTDNEADNLRNDDPVNPGEDVSDRSNDPHDPDE